MDLNSVYSISEETLRLLRGGVTESISLNNDTGGEPLTVDDATPSVYSLEASEISMQWILIGSKQIKDGCRDMHFVVRYSSERKFDDASLEEIYSKLKIRKLEISRLKYLKILGAFN